MAYAHKHIHAYAYTRTRIRIGIRIRRELRSLIAGGGDHSASNDMSMSDR